jgi:hypothetical protein
VSAVQAFNHAGLKSSIFGHSNASPPVEVSLDNISATQSLSVGVDKTSSKLKKIYFTVAETGNGEVKKTSNDRLKHITFTLAKDEIIIGIRLALDHKFSIH